MLVYLLIGKKKKRVLSWSIFLLVVWCPGNLGFILPASYITPVGTEMWAAVKVVRKQSFIYKKYSKKVV